MFGKRLWGKREFSLFRSVYVCLDCIYSPFLCLASESMLLSSATGTKQIHFIKKHKKNMRKKSLDYGKNLCALCIMTDEETKWGGLQEEMKKKSLKKEGYCGYERKWHQIYWRQCEKMRDTRLPPNLTKQDCCCPPAAATGGAPPHTIIGFHYAAISLK